MSAYRSGPAILAAYLASNRVEVPALDHDGFRAWLAARIQEQERNEVFRQKCLIRDLSRPFRRQLKRRAKAVELARSDYERSAHSRELELLARQIARLRKGVAGLAAAVAEGRADPLKLTGFEEALAQRERSHAELAALSPEKRQLDRAEASLVRLRNRIGLDAEEAALRAVQRDRGRRTKLAGSLFEETARRAVEETILPGLQSPERELVCLRGVTLGAARVELDWLVVGVSPGRKSTDALAVIEAKRNVNDLVKGFAMRQENLAWFTGAPSGYDPGRCRTAGFPTGHFDRSAVHQQDGRTYRFDRASFDGFRQDVETGCFLSGLWFVTEPRPLIGVTALELARILHRAATDHEFDLGCDASVRRFHQRTRPLVGRVQTWDVLHAYARQDCAGQIVFCDRENADESESTLSR